MHSDDRAEHFTLTPEQRSRLVPNIDVDALERFLQLAGETAEERDSIFELFVQATGQNHSFRVIGAVNNPVFDALLAEIYAPRSEALGADAVVSEPPSAAPRPTGASPDSGNLSRSRGAGE